MDHSKHCPYLVSSFHVPLLKTCTNIFSRMSLRILTDTDFMPFLGRIASIREGVDGLGVIVKQWVCDLLLLLLYPG